MHGPSIPQLVATNVARDRFTRGDSTAPPVGAWSTSFSGRRTDSPWTWHLSITRGKRLLRVVMGQSSREIFDGWPSKRTRSLVPWAKPQPSTSFANMMWPTNQPCPPHSPGIQTRHEGALRLFHKTTHVWRAIFLVFWTPEFGATSKSGRATASRGNTVQSCAIWALVRAGWSMPNQYHSTLYHTLVLSSAFQFGVGTLPDVHTRQQTAM